MVFVNAEDDPIVPPQLLNVVKTAAGTIKGPRNFPFSHCVNNLIFLFTLQASETISSTLNKNMAGI